VSRVGRSRTGTRGLRAAVAAAALVAGGACASHKPPTPEPPATPAPPAPPPQPQTPPPGSPSPEELSGDHGIASWYGPGFVGKETSNGERYDENRLTAAHAWLPFGTRVRVIRVENGRSVIVRINDRLQRSDRIIDLSRAAARTIGLIEPGTGEVRLEVLPRKGGADVATPGHDS
jgi:peptidoglycan lytic transglycosylase